MWKKGLTKYVSQIETKDNRIQATTFSFRSCNVLVINLYFMCDQRVNFVDTELNIVLGEIRRVIDVRMPKHITKWRS